MDYYLIIIISFLITIFAQIYIDIKYNSTRKIISEKRITGCEAARKILDANGLQNVKINRISGSLSDYYDPSNKTVNLSDDIYSNNSLASISVAAHECGHAIQDKNGYFFLKLRRKLVPLVNFSSKLGYLAIVIGLFASLTNFIIIGIITELVILLFQLITLPVEFNASNRALKQILELDIVNKNEKRKCKGMLKAAALTYVASVASTILEVLRLIMILRRRD